LSFFSFFAPPFPLFFSSLLFRHRPHLLLPGFFPALCCSSLLAPPVAGFPLKFSTALSSFCSLACAFLCFISQFRTPFCPPCPFLLLVHPHVRSFVVAYSVLVCCSGLLRQSAIPLFSFPSSVCVPPSAGLSIPSPPPLPSFAYCIPHGPAPLPLHSVSLFAQSPFSDFTPLGRRFRPSPSRGGPLIARSIGSAFVPAFGLVRGCRCLARCGLPAAGFLVRLQVWVRLLAGHPDPCVVRRNPTRGRNRRRGSPPRFCLFVACSASPPPSSRPAAGGSHPPVFRSWFCNSALLSRSP